MTKIINIKKESINVFGKDFKLPIKLDSLRESLGQGTIEELYDGTKIYVWKQNGFFVWLNDEMTTGIRINLNVENFDLCETNFQGQVLINDKNFNDAKWKNDKYGIGKVSKVGAFNLFLYKNSEFLIIKFPEDELEEKSNKYTLKHLDEPTLIFDNFNFKLCIIQELMYNKSVLIPKFDVYDFVKEYDEREIDINEEGYEAIKEVVDWFKEIEIPVSLATNIDEIIMDGGNDIYSQIIPFWDGEDDYFDIKDISYNEIKQFPNLKKITLLPSKNNHKIIEKLKGYGIEVDEL